MFDAWMNMWTKGPETMVNGWTAMNDAVPSVTDGDMPMWLTSLSTPVMAPAMVGAVAANTAVATWAGLWMGAPLAGVAAFSALTGGVAAAPAKPKTKPKTVAKVTVKPATKTAMKTAVKTAVKAAAPKTVTPEAAAPKIAKPAAKPAPAEQTAPKVDDRPAGLDAPKGGKADDLKQISGVGPKLESVLNDLGIYHFDQIAAWTKKEIAWVDDYLRFKGRIDRDGWIGQAKALAKEAA
jgi:branched-chain amino acid transport system ATP-binding protein